MRLLWSLGLIASFAVATSCRPGPKIDIDPAKPLAVFELHTSLREVSGLVAAGPDTVFVHNDEAAVIHEIGLTNGLILRSFAIGNPAHAGDFEGVTRIGAIVYAITSDGLIYETSIDKDRSSHSYSIYDTGLRNTCEIEGITADADGGLLLLCKRSSLDAARTRLIIYRWSLQDKVAPPALWLNVSLEGLVPRTGKGGFRASGLERDPNSGHLLLLDSKAGALVEIGPDGSAAGYYPLWSGNHPQAEGVAIMADGRIVVADEGAARATGRLTVYAASLVE